MTRLLQCMPVVLELFRVEEPHWYEIICYFKFHFYLNLLVDVLHALNELIIKFQYDMVDVTTISTTININILDLSPHFYPGRDLCLVV